VRTEISCGVGFFAEFLDGGHDLFLLDQDGFTETLGPFEIVVHPF